MSNVSPLHDSKYRNWVRAGTGLKYCKQGLEPFTDKLLDKQHKDILTTFGASANSCNNCNWRTLKPNHNCTQTQQRQRQGQRVCPFGQLKCNCLYPNKISCLNNICGNIYDTIITLHASTPPKPKWKNVNAQSWCENHWEFGKCFINTPGYEQKTSAAEIDCSGLLHVFINNKDFHQHVQCTIQPFGSDPFNTVLERRNEILHNGRMELEDSAVDSCLQDMIAVLEDPRELLQNKEAQTAVMKLEELRMKKLYISYEDELDVIKSSMCAMEARQTELEEKVNEVVESVHKQEIEQKVSLSVLEKSTKESIDQLKTDHSSVLQDLSKRVENIESKETENTEAIKEIKETLSEVKAENAGMVQLRIQQKQQLDYINQKKEFQIKLKNMYLDKVVPVSALPLRPERDNARINDLYVTPRVTGKEMTKLGDKEVAIESFHHFFRINGTIPKSIYLTGEVGSGKSAFCKNIIYKWCMAHSTCDEEMSIDADMKEMKTFEFLFYLPLRQNKQYCSVDEMLKHRYNSPVLNDVIKCESSFCLILMDGLDEWVYPKSIETVPQFQTRGLPDKNQLEKAVTITTSRPWKIEALKLKDSEMAKRMKLEGIGDESVRRFSDMMIRHLNERYRKQKSEDEFFELLSQTCCKEFKNVPVMLQQLICLWFEDKDIGSSRCDIYSSMVELLLEWYSQTSVGTSKFGIKQTHELEKVSLPKSLAEKEAFSDYSHIIFKIGQLAYLTTFSEQTHLSQSFGKRMLEEAGLETDIVNNILKIGILTEEQGMSLSSGRSSSLAFPHKSIQDFLAAVYICMQKSKPSGNLVKTADEQYRDCVQNYLGKCTTIENILEHSGLLIMLCGLEPSFTTYVSDYIYKTVDADERIAKYTEDLLLVNNDTVKSVKDLLMNVQSITFECVNEMDGSEIVPVYLRDIFLSQETNEIILKQIDRDRIVSLRCFGRNENKSISNLSRILCHLSSTSMLADISLCTMEVQHEDISPLTSFLERSKCLQKISTFNVHCSKSECKDHEVDLSRHRNLQQISDECSDLHCVSINTSSLKSIYISAHAVLFSNPSQGNSCLESVSLYWMRMSHKQMNDMISYLERSTLLQSVVLEGVKCEREKCYGQAHKINFSKQKKMRVLTVRKCDVQVTCGHTACLEIFSLEKCTIIYPSDQYGIAKRLQDSEDLFYTNFTP